MTLSKSAALAKLKKLLEQSRSIQGLDAVGWERNVTLALTRIFDDGAHLNDFNRMANLTTQRVILQSMFDEVQDYWPDDDSKGLEAVNSEPLLPEPGHGVNINTVRNRKKVFVVHGRNPKLRSALFVFLRAIGLNPTEWAQAVKDTGKSAPYVGEILDTAFSTAQAVVVLFTQDDRAYLRESLRRSNDPPYESTHTLQARPNVLFEAGMAMGRCPDRTVLVQIGNLRPFSDIGGRHIIELNDSTERRQQLAQRLESAGCDVDLTGVDWHSEGVFTP